MPNLESETVELHWRYAKQFVSKHGYWPQTYFNFATGERECLSCPGKTYKTEEIVHTKDCPYLRFRDFEARLFAQLGSRGGMPMTYMVD